MRILNISAQRASATGSGVYLRELVAAQQQLGHEAFVVSAYEADELTALERAELASVSMASSSSSDMLSSNRTAVVYSETFVFDTGHNVPLFPLVYHTDRLPFAICGMSDVMPYPSTRYKDMTPAMLDTFEAEVCRVLEAALLSSQPEVVVSHHLFLITALLVETVDRLHNQGRLLVKPRLAGICHATCLRQLAQRSLPAPYIERIHQAIAHLDVVAALHAQQLTDIAQEFSALPAEKCYLLGTGYNAQIFSPAGDKLPDSMLFVGKVCQSKGALSLARALPRAAQLLASARIGHTAAERADAEHASDAEAQAHGTSLTLTLVGGRSNNDAEYQVIVEQLAQLREAGVKTHLTGVVLQDDLVAAYREAEVFVLPSFYEGLPLVMLEALACGCKVVISDLPGIRPWIEAHLSNAPIWWVAPPRMLATGSVDSEDLPAFEERLAQALAAALVAPAPQPAMEHLSWAGLCKRLLAQVCISATVPQSVGGSQSNRAVTHLALAGASHA